MEVDEEIMTDYVSTILGIIPEGWQIKKLKDVVVKSGEYGLNAPAVEYDEKLPKYLRITDIDEEGNFCIKQRKSVSHKDSIKFYVGDNDILFVRTGATVGKSYLYKNNDGKLVFAGFLIRFTLDTEKVDKYFIWSYTKSSLYWNWVKMNSMRSGQPGLNSKEYGLLNIALPPLSEQKAIADCLSTWDNAIEKLSALIGKKELQKKALMQQLLTGKKRLKGFSGEWKEVHIWDIATEVSIKNKTNEDLTVLSCTKYDGLVPSLEYFGRRIYSDDLTTYKVVPQAHFAYATNHIEEGSIGYQDRFAKALISPMYTVFKTDNTIDDGFFFRLLKSHKLMHEYNVRMEGSIDRRGGLRWDAFSIIKIHIPELREQEAIAAVLQQADKEIVLLQTKLDKLKQQKKGLMQVLLTGKKRLKYE